MQIKLNGQWVQLEQGTNIAQIVEQRGLHPHGVVVEVNLNIKRREEWDQTILQENDEVEILTFVGGG